MMMGSKSAGRKSDEPTVDLHAKSRSAAQAGRELDPELSDRASPAAAPEKSVDLHMRATQPLLLIPDAPPLLPRCHLPTATVIARRGTTLPSFASITIDTHSHRRS